MRRTSASSRWDGMDFRRSNKIIHHTNTTTRTSISFARFPPELACDILEWIAASTEFDPSMSMSMQRLVAEESCRAAIAVGHVQTPKSAPGRPVLEEEEEAYRSSWQATCSDVAFQYERRLGTHQRSASQRAAVTSLSSSSSS
jgi:hypothetical protein